MVREQRGTEDHRDPIVRLSQPAMEWRDVDLTPLLACARRELALRKFVYPKRIAEGKLSEAKARQELEAQQQIVDFLVHCVFKAVTQRRRKAQGE